MANADIHFYFDPICPFAWMTSKWVREVVAQRDYRAEWKFISLRMVNRGVDYATHFPEGYEATHTAGLRLLRVAAAARSESGNEAVGAFYREAGSSLFESSPGGQERLVEDIEGFLEPVLGAAGLPARLAGAAGEDAWDGAIATETEDALARTGKDVGTPIIHFQPPEGVAFFGPVISRLPAGADAVALWDHVVALAAFPGFAELKRSLREVPQLPAFGVSEGEVGAEQDWQQGHRRMDPSD